MGLRIFVNTGPDKQTCLLSTSLVSTKVEGHETSLDNAESWSIKDHIIEFLLHVNKEILATYLIICNWGNKLNSFYTEINNPHSFQFVHFISTHKTNVVSSQTYIMSRCNTYYNNILGLKTFNISIDFLGYKGQINCQIKVQITLFC